MNIVIDYEASWRNSFLDGDNNKNLPKKGRKFIASMSKLKKKENFIFRPVTKDTVMGVLNRLIGDQRKLYQTRSTLGDATDYFANIEDKITFHDNPKAINQETVYIRNMTGSTDQNSFTGMIKVNNPIFQSDYSKEFWGVLALDIDQLFSFVLNNTIVSTQIGLDPTSILNKLREIKKIKPLDNSDQAKITADCLDKHFEQYKAQNAKGQLLVINMYCSALYLQLRRLAERFDMQSAKSKQRGISGISHNGFTPKDFMDRYTTGPKKLIYGGPYIREEYVKGEGKVKHYLTKASGQLTIKLNIDLAKANELKEMIDNAGVSAFYLGKKGLAYVSRVDVRLR